MFAETHGLLGHTVSTAGFNTPALTMTHIYVRTLSYFPIVLVSIYDFAVFKIRTGETSSDLHNQNYYCLGFDSFGKFGFQLEDCEYFRII